MVAIGRLLGKHQKTRSKTAQKGPEVMHDADYFVVPVGRRSEQWRPRLLSSG